MSPVVQSSLRSCLFLVLLGGAAAAYANEPPTVNVTTPVTFTLTNGALSTQVQAVERAEDAAGFYDYFSASSHTGFETPFESKLFLYRDTTSGALSLFFTHGIDADTSGIFTPMSRVVMNLDGVPPGTFVAQSDDPFQGGRAELDLALEPEGFWTYSNNTDGGVLGGLPTTVSWCITITPLSWLSIDSWVYHYASGTSIVLDMSLPVTLCFEPATDLDVLDVDEGNDVSLSGSFDDPDAMDSHVAVWDFGDGTSSGTTFSPGPGATHHDCDPVFHVYGDDGSYIATLTVDDDAGGQGQDTIEVRVHNVAPGVSLDAAFVTGIGIGIDIPAQGVDPGSDDLSFTWDFGDGSPTVTNEYFNDGIGPDGLPTPGGVFPYAVTDTVRHAWCTPGTFVLTLEVADDDGGVTSRVAAVEVLAFPSGPECNEPPTCDAGPAIGVPCHAIFVEPSASDPDGDPLVFLWTSSCPGTLFLPGPDVFTPVVLLPDSCDQTCELTLHVSDGNGGTCADVVLLSLLDDVPPTIESCPSSMSVECDGAGNLAQRQAWLDSFVASDICSGVTLSHDGSGMPGCGGGNSDTVTFVATDLCGNEASCTATFTIADTTAPSLVGVPADFAVACDAVPAVAAVTATDACDAAPVIDFAETRVDGPCPGSYTLTRTWTATDDCGNAGSESQVIEVRDDVAPSLAGVPADALVACDAVPAVAVVTATDNCDAAPVIDFEETRVDGPCPSTYTLTRTWTATDACGNASSDSQVVEVRDDVAPSLVGVPANAIVACDAVPAVAVATATDNCDAAPVIDFEETRVDGPCPSTYTLTRTWTATDACGNASSDSQVIEVQDGVAPSLAGVPADAVVACDAVPAVAVVTATDNCEAAPAIDFAETRVDGPCPSSYTLTRTWTATDACGNASSDSQVIEVRDDVAPVVTESLAEVACLWPPNHRMVSFGQESFGPAILDACSTAMTWSFVGCASDQPDDDIGDGSTSGDCVVAPDGLSFAVRAERQGTEPAGRRYTVSIVATDDCGNASSPTAIGTILVPHDQSPKGDCLRTTGGR